MQIYYRTFSHYLIQFHLSPVHARTPGEVCVFGASVWDCDDPFFRCSRRFFSVSSRLINALSIYRAKCRETRMGHTFARFSSKDGLTSSTVRSTRIPPIIRKHFLVGSTFLNASNTSLSVDANDDIGGEHTDAP